MPSSRARPPIAIVTDFGYRDHYVGAMKGVIAGIAPAAALIDLTHGIPAQSIIAGAIALRQSWRYFPKRTVFLAVVDPGVGTARLPIAIETRAGARFVGPDNGLLWMAARDAGITRAVELRAARYRLAGVSSTFHGRDIFAPAAAHLWSGVALRSLGPAVKELTELAIEQPERSGDMLAGRIIYTDGFGNLVSNLDRQAVERFAACFRRRKLLVRIESGAQMEILNAYGDAPAGAPLATFGSFELLEIAVRDGSAASFFGAGEGARVSIVVSA